MIKFKRTLFVMFVALLLMSFTNIYLRMTAETVIVLPKGEIVLVPVEIEKILIEIDQTDKFLDAIGMRESSNRYDVVNGWGYMGKYQFGKRTLRGLGFKQSKEEFLNSPAVQEEAMYALLKQNKRSLRKYIIKYEGEIVNGVLVTESGLLAAAHLGGAGSVKKWFRTGKVRKDGNGVKITTYMTKFSGYKLLVP